MNRQEFETYALGGHGSITVRSLKTGQHYTFRFSWPKDRKPGQRPFVSVLYNADQWAYLGLADFDQRRVIKTKASRFPAVAENLTWLMRQREFNPEQVEVLHDGTCGRCGRTLTHPDSIKSGIGPVCAGRE